MVGAAHAHTLLVSRCHSSLITEHGLVNNELIYLNFRLPWEENDPPIAPKGAGGGKKKK